ncbi:pancreatic triacylglycerol lipase-like [Colletes gigas]|uniref:pancreatic triacylglycerol lipase-like n=1 Tax=Colletes gigas TaxID=935657 RepID=UPI001C9AD2C1|nr:pancreatic triacylglycerol lipase-like [Colletes gigas]
MKILFLSVLLLFCSGEGSIECKEQGSMLSDGTINPDALNLHLAFPETLAETKKQLPKYVTFYLYTRSNPTNPQTLHVDDVNTLRSSFFDSRRPTVIVTHGWVSSYTSLACTTVRDAYLQHGDYNVISVDWSPIAKNEYIWATRRVTMIGQYISSMINFLETQGMNVSTLTVVGHSLGAHIAGLAARNANGTVLYVVGLDPARPNFSSAGLDTRIGRGDGRYVLIIHTCSGILGFEAAIGDSDFYPNGGTVQPSCGANLSCSHERSYRFFAESINSRTGFWAKRCNNYVNFIEGNCNSEPPVLMGGATPNFNAKGVYYLKTASKSPYALGA